MRHPGFNLKSPFEGGFRGMSPQNATLDNHKKQKLNLGDQTMQKTIFILLLALALPLLANNITVGTPSIARMVAASDYAMVRFDLSWENSFRDDLNWDAAWVFVKYKPAGGDWQHATLNTTAGNHIIPSGYSCSVGTTGGAGMGVFIYRSANGSGDTDLGDVLLRWEYGENGIAVDDEFSLNVFAIEMVYTPEGDFYVGNGDDEYSYQSNTYATYGFQDGDSTEIAYHVTASPVVLDSTDGCLWATGLWDSTSCTLQADFPTGYNAFYMMKYETSQGQYADFLNTLTTTQDGNRFPDKEGDERHTIGGTAGSYYVSRPSRACNYISWMDGAAYADWAGLRPMTEMELEKHGYSIIGKDGNYFTFYKSNLSHNMFAHQIGTMSLETVFNGTVYEDVVVLTPTGQPQTHWDYMINIGDNYGYINTPPLGVVRCGIFATADTDDQDGASASITGAMELSGNLSEMVVNVGNSTGRLFAGSHGDGALSANGCATNTDWPGYAAGEVTSATGTGWRGGGWSTGSLHYCFVGCRDFMIDTFTGQRHFAGGFRAVRTAE